MSSLALYVSNLKKEMPWGELSPRCFETQRSMHRIAKAALVFSGFSVAATIAGALIAVYCFPGQQVATIVIPIIGSTGVVVVVVFSVYLLKKSYWQDPVFRLNKRAEVIDALEDGYLPMKSKYGENCYNYSLITNEEIREYVWRGPYKGKNYEQMQQDRRFPIGALLKDNILHQEEAAASLLTGEPPQSCWHFVKQFGFQPLEDRVLTSKDPFQNDETLRSLFLEEIENATFDQIFKAYGSTRFWKLFDYNIAKKEDLTGRLLHELESCTFSELLARYGWKVFDYGIVASENELVRIRFEEFLKNKTSIIEFFQKEYENAQRFKLIPEGYSRKIESLRAKYQAALNIKSQKMAKICRDFEHKSFELEINKRARVESAGIHLRFLRQQQQHYMLINTPQPPHIATAIFLEQTRVDGLVHEIEKEHRQKLRRLEETKQRKEKAIRQKTEAACEAIDAKWQTFLHS